MRRSHIQIHSSRIAGSEEFVEVDPVVEWSRRCEVDDEADGGRIDLAEVVGHGPSMDEASLKSAVDRWLLEDGPLSIDELARRLVAAGLVVESDEVDEPMAEDHVGDLLTRSDDYWTTEPDDGDELVVLTSTFVETGMTFTHRVTADDLEHGSIAEVPDLSVLLWNCRDGLPFGDGEIVTDDSTPSAPRVEGPAGWLASVESGDVIALTRTDGVVSMRVVADGELGDGGAEVAALHSAAQLWVSPGRGMDETALVMEALARHPDMFRRPVPPVSELLEEAGLEGRDREWGWADTGWRTRREAYEDHDSNIKRLFGFDDCCDRAYDRLGQAFRDHLPGMAVDGRALANDLAHGTVAQAFAFGHQDLTTLVSSFATAAIESTTGRHRAPWQGLLGLARLSADDPVGAVEALSAAVSSDAHGGFASSALAELELDRGDLARAHTLALADEWGEGLVEWIEVERDRQAGLRPTAGRNDPCPCGSGRKFKKCCALAGALSLADRVPFVLQRLGHFALGPYGHSELFGLVLSAVGRHDDVVDAVGRFRGDSFLIDVALHECGLSEVYLAQREALLAADEVSLIESALEEPRRLWEITEVDAGSSLTLRDTGSGDVVTVVERSGSLEREPGELLLARVIAVGDVAMMFGVPLLVPLRQRDRVMRVLDGYADPDALASWYGSLSLPPELQNREGEDLVLRRTVCEVDEDTALIVELLDDLYGRDGDELIWTETTTVAGEEGIVRGTVRLDGSTLVVESNSEERQARILGALDELFPYDVVEDSGSDPFDLVGDLDDDEDAGPVGMDDMPEEVRELVERQMREYEERWCDEAVPALDGLTPRQALDDPTRREDLFALLREMRRMSPPEGAFGMSVDRIEELLGIASE